MHPYVAASRRNPMRALVASFLCIMLADQSLIASPPAKIANSQKPGQVSSQLEGDQRVLHALNRFTFGPRPGELAAVEKTGLKRWFEQQLNPSSIDDSALGAHLASFPAMKLSQEELLRRYPSTQMLRAIENQHLPIPADPTERAIYADQLAFYKMAQERKAAAKDATEEAAKGDGDNAALPGDMMDPGTPAMNEHEEKLYSGLQAVKIINLPPDQRMERLIAMSPQELIAFKQSLSRRELAEAAEGLSPEQKETLLALSGSRRVVASELLQSRLMRDIYSDRQLEAVMTDFWLNHFNIYLRKNQNEPYLLFSFERDVVRPRAFGKFEDLLVATAQSPAMLMYLDNWQSIGPDSMAAERIARQRQRTPAAKGKAASGLNENYARELMELHTLGVNGGYTQADVTQVAKVFTGWTIERPNEGGAYRFEPNRHEPGSKQVLGSTIQDKGEQEGLQVLHMLATSPSTARFISTKLAIRFVSDDPPAALVDKMTKSFLVSGGDIRAVLRTLFNAPEFWSPAINRAKVKTPLEFVVSAARATNAQISNAQPLVQSLDKLGMPLYGMQTPNGYDWTAEKWVSTGALVSRMNIALLLGGDRMPGVRVGLEQTLASPAVSLHTASLEKDAAALQKEKQLEILVLGQPASDHTRSTVLQQSQGNDAWQVAERQFPIKADDPEQLAGSVGGGKLFPPFSSTASLSSITVDKQAGVMAGLLIGSPEFQRR